MHRSSAPHQIAALELFWCLHWLKCPAHPSWGITGLGQAVLGMCKGTAVRLALPAVGDCSPEVSRTESLLPCSEQLQGHRQAGRHFTALTRRRQALVFLLQTPRISVY